jgi:hypothetical protein
MCTATWLANVPMHLQRITLNEARGMCIQKQSMTLHVTQVLISLSQNNHIDMHIDIHVTIYHADMELYIQCLDQHQSNSSDVFSPPSLSFSFIEHVLFLHALSYRAYAALCPYRYDHYSKRSAMLYHVVCLVLSISVTDVISYQC